VAGTHRNTTEESKRKLMKATGPRFAAQPLPVISHICESV
jgi:hypothetical protein